MKTRIADEIDSERPKSCRSGWLFMVALLVVAYLSAVVVLSNA
jgi:hypothetical protein